ncbi:MAG: 3-dehydroquinate synthase [Nitrospirota bacterium]|nr:3-dehydroquinate synthase [Nitrospirota bacterium]MDH5767558.1 3-dehydroquinate synthase [Nitrospirota bacterium]
MKKTTEKIRVALGERSYDISIGSNILDRLGDNLKSFGLSPRIAIISNPKVYPLYGKRVSDSIKNAGFNAITVTIPDGEEYKDLLWIQHIYDELLKAKLDRSSALIALGGGVVGDITGFAASTYMRGISYIQVPTTLLAQVDSSVGGKTGVNHKLGKNMIGTFWQPKLVWIDVATLKTLPLRELRAGLAEVIKYGVIWDEKLFDFLELNRNKILSLDRDSLVHIIKRSCEIKAEVVSKDERESGLRAILNYGHTIGHAIETVTGYKRYLHGEAVAIGMCLEARLSTMLKFIDNNKVVRIKSLIESYGLPSEMPAGIDIKNILSSIQLDKKAIAGELKFILPERIGNVKIYKGLNKKVLKEMLRS